MGATARGDSKIRVTEIFHSIQGESTRVGLPTVFVRLTGCPLRCTWCDTEYAFTGGEIMPIRQVLDRIAAYACPTVCVTGGEPLAQKDCPELLTALCDAGYSVSLETSGALDVCGLDDRISRIVDLKAPDSGESEKNRWENIACLTAKDELKLVLASEADYAWAKSVLVAYRLNAICPVLFSPVADRLSPAQLAEWVLRDKLPVRFQLQLHKTLWNTRRGV